MATVAICICTYKREHLLGECLASLARMEVPAHVGMQIVVIDNDAQQASRDMIAQLGESFPYQLHYECEPKQGIPCARNRAIDKVHELQADYLVFIDDDERVEPDWLVRLYEYCMAKGGKAVIHGGVFSLLPVGTPQHIRSLYNKQKRRTGDRLNSCATNNVIVPIWVTQELGLRFDESKPLAGGTDTIFFSTAVSEGVEIFECAEALVKETLPVSRTTLKWWMKRKYRAGITEAWRKRQAGRSVASILISAVLQFLVETLKTIVLTLVVQLPLRNRCWLKACRSAGVIAGVFGAKVDSYKQIDS